MSKTYMITAPWGRGYMKFMLKQFIKKHDIHKWIFAHEVSENGYEHLQGRFTIGDGSDFDTLREELFNGHLEEASEAYDYERKGGIFLSSEDTPEIRQTRFGKPREWQIEALEILDMQSTREILVLVDEEGNNGKSWLCNHLYETGEGYYVPPTMTTVKDMIQFVASGYNFEDYIIIDIPRSWKWSENIYTGIETIKDGLIYDTRYTAKTRNIRGVKIMVLSNTKPKVGKLSMDRWNIWRLKKGQLIEYAPASLS